MGARVIAYGASGSRDTLGTATVNRQGAKTPRLLVASSTACGTGSAIDSLASWRLGGSTDPSRMDSGGPRAATLSYAITLSTTPNQPARRPPNATPRGMAGVAGPNG